MSFRFEKLQIWQDARKFTGEIYSITKKFPSSEKYGLTNQLRRASVSICLNIEEPDKKSDIEFRRYLRMAIGSCEEVVTALYVALDQNTSSRNDCTPPIRYDVTS